jgi:lipopolysaccharide biosynthesis regulator YciM
MAVRAELAQDYLKAGLFDRAEEIFVTLTNERYQQAALRALLEIYTREREWQQSIKIATELERISGVPFRQEIAQYYCELAVKSVIEQDNHSARQQLEMALDANKDCVRANIMLGDMEAAEGNHKVALSVWKRIEFQEPRYLALIAPKMLNSYKALKKMSDGIQLLHGYFEKYKLHSLFNVLFDVTLNEQGSEVAEHMALQDLQRKPSLQTLEHLFKARSLNQPANAEVHTILQTVRSSIGNRSAYCCEQCGFRAKHFHWQCPACNAWESLPSEPDESHL